MNDLLRQIPPVHELQKLDALITIRMEHQATKRLWTSWIQKAVESLRQDILQSEHPNPVDFQEIIIKKTRHYAKQWGLPALHKVINGTGTVLHTNLGRARLSEKAVARIVEVSGNYSNLEYDMEKGKRGSRHDVLERRLKEITGAEAAMVVNNNAAAVYLILRALAKGKKVIVSRGELVEIGGSFRVSKVMEESDAQLVEVGTTNKTHLYDYEEAIDEETAMIMKVHTSNFYMEGFTESQSTASLAPLTKEKDLIFYEDLGSGSIVDYQAQMIGKEPVVSDIIAQGTDLVSFSGDKLLGGPQAGIIAGRKQYIDILKKHQLARVLRVDKMTLAALESTLQEYGRDNIGHGNDVYRDITKRPDKIKKDAENFVDEMKNIKSLTLKVKPCTSRIGGGTMPEVELPSFGIKITSENMSPETIEKFMRINPPYVIGRFLEESYFLDFRTITPPEIELMKQALNKLDAYMS
ncbi:L-seryl-tRNA(Sec) selenium transferase [Thalassobacillus devorans]|uniref:L-seryl-tRNA(Sec) selenium transferase n=1 Tax=Thalassobacillus devorans TaxID=279813 RepID=A0ABQ1P1D6_9BACI|nr:L-seryl-tRNA(Sec) selenium transferase [Thalassobacillus devorans]NIK28100.1 L-seryl-tRNA(Ser) seleniumtransferase [Thalassobacillus devorans]GGC88851.1 L-seryl-tRNA(Sec) selenium transferase [Thalassobacillus devorans]